MKKKLNSQVVDLQSQVTDLKESIERTEEHSVAIGVYYVRDDLHWGREVRQRTVDSYRTICWCGSGTNAEGRATAEKIAHALNCEEQ